MELDCFCWPFHTSLALLPDREGACLYPSHAGLTWEPSQEMWQSHLKFAELQPCFQGEMVNNIERNVVNSVDYVEHAKEETKKAIKYQSKARRKKWIIAAVAVAVIAVLALIIGLSVGK